MGLRDPHCCLFCQITIVYAPKIIAEGPASRPSTRSVRLAPWEVAVTMNQITSCVSLLNLGVSGWEVAVGGSFPYLPDKDDCHALAEEAAGHVDPAGP